jgi:hypothetical protein
MTERMTQESVLELMQLFAVVQNTEDRQVVDKAADYLRLKFTQYNEEKRFARLHLNVD